MLIHATGAHPFCEICQAIEVVEGLRHAVGQTFAIEVWRTTWESRTAADVTRVAAYIETLDTDQITDLVERIKWATGRVERQRKSPAGSTEHWDALMAEVEFQLTAA